MFTSELIELNDILARYDAKFEDVPVSLLNYALMESRMDLVDTLFREGRVSLPNNSYLGWVNWKPINKRKKANMKMMTMDEIRTQAGYRASRMTARMTQLIKDFLASGVEAAEIEPEDLGRNDFECGKATRNQVQSIRHVFNRVVVQLGVEDMCGFTGPGGHVYIYRKDI